MRLDRLIDALAERTGFDGLVAHASDRPPARVEITAVECDSRSVGPGALFCCVPGTRSDGHEHAAAAVASGAVALVCERPVGLDVPELRVASVRRAMGPLAATFYDDPSHRLEVVGVTGTNGKTTTTYLLAAVLDAAGMRCGLIGTMTGERTTPEAPELQRLLAGFTAEGYRAVAVEVSSHALVQHRVDGTRFAVAAFTNLSQDHLDYHDSMESYFAAKARLFEPDLAERAVVNLDDPHGRLLRDATSVPAVGFSLDDASGVDMRANGTRFTWRGMPMHLELAGRLNLANAVAAATIAGELGVAPAAVAEGLARVGPVAGRFELIDAGQPFLVVVDYAHTPDGLAKVLEAARSVRPNADGRVIVVFGCGGERDPSKRRGMGEAASDGADVVVVTSDNPRSEDPGAIIDDVLEGIGPDDRPMVEPDRRAAIAVALDAARPGDVVVVAGKGHETTQVVGDRTIPFDDRAVVRELLTR